MGAVADLEAVRALPATNLRDHTHVDCRVKASDHGRENWERKVHVKGEKGRKIAALKQFLLKFMTTKVMYLSCLFVTVLNSSSGYTLSGVSYTLAKLAICFCILHFGYWSLD